MHHLKTLENTAFHTLLKPLIFLADTGVFRYICKVIVNPTHKSKTTCFFAVVN